MTIFHLVRHAETDALGKTLSGRADNIGLNPAGLRQADQVASILQGLRIQAIYSSPMRRAQETAGRFAAASKLPVLSNDAFNEVDFGDWAGRAFANLADDSRWQRFNSFRSSTAAPQGELMLDVQTRTTRELESLSELHADAEVAIFTHADVIRAILCHYAGIPVDLMLRIEISPASISSLHLSHTGVLIGRINFVDRTNL